MPITYSYADIAFLCASLLLLFGALAIRLSGRNSHAMKKDTKFALIAKRTMAASNISISE